MNSTNKVTHLLLAAVVSFAAALPAHAAAPAGYSAERLARVDALLDSYVNEGRIGGIVALVLRDGKPMYQHAAGWIDKEAGRKMTMDAEFRIASQSKALTSVAILQLMEEGKLTVNDRAGKYIPTFEQTTVLTRVENSTTFTTVPAKPDPHQGSAHAHCGHQLWPGAGLRSDVHAQGSGRGGWLRLVLRR
jgi:CubicO group peptidase (beta-lactamase class C family)